MSSAHRSVHHQIGVFARYINHCLVGTEACEHLRHAPFELLPIDADSDDLLAKIRNGSWNFGLKANFRDRLNTGCESGWILAKFCNFMIPDTLDERALNMPKRGSSARLWSLCALC